MQRIIKLFFLTRIWLITITYFGSIIFPKVANGGIGAIGPGHDFNFLASWAQWDGGNYFLIAKYGHIDPKLYAFFPLYPILIKLTSYLLLGNILVAGLVLANFFALAFFIFFFELVKNKFSEKLAYLSTVTLLTFPTSYFLSAFYSESLFLLLIVLTLLMLEEKKFWAAAMFTSLATVTRFMGILLVFVSFFSYLKSINFTFKKINYKILTIPVSFLPIITYCVYLYYKFKNPFYFFTIEQTWHRNLANPFTTIYAYVSTNLTTKPFNDYLDVIVTVAFLALLIWRMKKIPLAWWFFATLAIVVPASTATLTSMPRYALSSIPTFIIIGDLLKSSQFLQILIWGVFLILQVALAVMFINGYWTA